MRIEPFEPRRNREVLLALAVWAQRFSPTVALDGDDGLMLDIAGCQRLFKGEQNLLDTMLAALRRLGFAARGAIAPTYACAAALARFAPELAPGMGVIVDQSQVRGALEALPVRALGMDEKTKLALEEVGIERVGHVMKLPRSSLPSRFAEPLLATLDRALGQGIETIEPVRVRAALRVERVFDGPTLQLEAIRAAVRELLGELTKRLLARESGVRLLELTLERADLGPARVQLELTRPTRDGRHLWRLIGPRLERMHLGYGVEGVHLRAAQAARLSHQQMERWTDAPGRDAGAEQAGAELLDTLAGKLGSHGVRRVELVASHVPERAWREWNVLDEERAGAVNKMAGAAGGVTGADRPTTLFDPPRNATAVSVTPDGPVMGLWWQGQELRVRECVGPERIAGEWWREAYPTRDYFKVQDQHGRWLWVCREIETGQWFVHGLWA